MMTAQPLCALITGLGVITLPLATPALAQITAAPDGTGTTVTQSGNDYAITGGSASGDGANLFHSFTDFNLTTGQSAVFFTDPAVANILGRITGGNLSLINGLLGVSGSNANLFLLNPAGILFGPDSALNLGGSFTAATADSVNFATGSFGLVGSSDYATLVGDPTGFSFNAPTPGSIVNSGDLAVSPGEAVVLVGGQVINTGTIAAPGGDIIITAVEGGNRVRIAQAGQVLNLEVEALPGGTANPLPFTPATLPQLLTGNAVTQATGVTVAADGTVTLTGDSPPLPDQAGTAMAAGTLTATGGQVDVLGTTVGLIDAQIDVSADFGGGQIRIGGDYLGAGPVPNAQVTYVDANTTLNADATLNGNGGRIILWSDAATRSYGSLTAQGGPLGGNGGFIETSSRGYLDHRGAPNVSAPLGQGGTWLIDPFDISIVIPGTGTSPNVTGGPVFTATSGIPSPALLDWGDIIAALPGNTVVVSTAGAGGAAGNIDFPNGNLFYAGAAGTLQLFANTQINFNHDIVSVNPLNITAVAGNIVQPAGFTLSTGGGDLNFRALDPAGISLDGTLNAGDGKITLQADTGSVTLSPTAALNTGGDDLDIIAGLGITSAVPLITGGGDALLSSSGPIVIDSLNATGGPGNISITTPQFLRVTNTFLFNGIATSIGSSGGSITITHGGNGVTPFIVGNPAVNGTAGAIATGANVIRTTQSFLFTYVQANIAINSTTPNLADCLQNPDGLCDRGGEIEADPEEDAGLEEDWAIANRCDFPVFETVLTQRFVDHLSLTKPEIVDLAGIQAALQTIEAETGVRSAIIYACFAPDASETIATEIADASTKARSDSTIATLGPDTAVPQRQVLELTVVTPDEEPIYLRVPDADRDQVMVLARTFRDEVADPSKTRTRSYLPAAQALYTWLLEPLAADLESRAIDHLSFVMDSGLRSLPIAALHSGEGFLIEDYSLGLMPSVSLTNTRYRALRDVPILAAGAAEFSDQVPLPAVPVEVETIATQLWPGTTLLNETFTFDNLQTTQRQRHFGIVHLATHGEFLPGDAANSYIQLWQQKLRLDQIPQLGWADPLVDLVVLSACRLALGSEEAELGFAGMAVQSGAKSVLASLWNVDDAGTMGLMLEFYQQLQSAPIKAEAVRQAQLQLLKQEVGLRDGQVTWSGGTAELPPALLSTYRHLDHPYFWAAFTLVGNPW
jgi:filamentous hemagglutinin family protein